MKLSDYDPRNHPRSTQFVMTAIMAGMFTWCWVACMGSSLPELIFIDMPIHLGIAALACLLLMTLNNLMSKSSAHSMEPKLADIYALQGSCKEMADLLNRRMPQPTPQDQMLRTFLLAVTGNREEAAEQFAAFPTGSLPLRQFAMVMTAKLIVLFQEGSFSKICNFFEANRCRLDAAYESEPHWNGQFCAYADDRLEYYLLAAVSCTLCRQHEQAAEYRRKAVQQAQNRSAEEAAAYQQLAELQRLYASDSPDAAAAETALLHTISALNAAVPAGARINLRRAAERAKFFAPARLGAAQYFGGERPLPQS